ncbi:iron-siderophore ABC transporter substrate-binding protein [Roseivivax isoporae]|uniref:ABC transporter substrate-binding protein n=1 Tax=Roseivivax isoporae LMG 25204 TaxID=1449351 RepID=X7FA53_9RHOB|nr:iron-siderophore ABC transporter substrate-binding protein [Roseivivax isoporae]ETX28964.1 ABC transporter substrate-binding protein [Roseivivax isoporae LMG 25204]
MSRVAFLGAVAALLALVSPTRPAAEGFPVTVEHSFGTTTIERQPDRVATVAWANHEVPLALGIVPVGFARANFGDDDGDGVLPWVAERLAELGAPAPQLFDEGDGIDFEAVAASRPDVILAAYSGLSRQDYDILSRIAPVIPHADGAWATGWREMIRLNAAGLGRAEDGAALIDRIEARIAEVTAAHPALADKTAMFVTHLDARDLSVIRFYSANDTRTRFLADLGLDLPRSVRDASEPGRFSGEISAERIDDFADVDILVTYGGPDLLARIRENPLTSRMQAVAGGGVVLLGNDPAGTAATPTPLSIEWVLEEYVARLADAARTAE